MMDEKVLNFTSPTLLLIMYDVTEVQDSVMMSVSRKILPFYRPGYSIAMSGFVSEYFNLIFSLTDHRPLSDHLDLDIKYLSAVGEGWGLVDIS